MELLLIFYPRKVVDRGIETQLLVGVSFDLT